MRIRLRTVLVSAAVAVTLGGGLVGCNTKRWDEIARTNAEWAEARKLNTCLTAQGGLEPYGYGQLVFGTGGAKVETCAKIFGLPGASTLPTAE